MLMIFPNTQIYRETNLVGPYPFVLVTKKYQKLCPRRNVDMGGGVTACGGWAKENALEQYLDKQLYKPAGSQMKNQ